MIRNLYSLALWLAQPLLLAKLRQRARQEPGYGQAVAERFGRYAQPALPAAAPEAAPLVWLHAVSLGETRAAAVLVAALRQCYPGLRLLLTHGTASGRAQGSALLREGDIQVWQPWDTPAAVRRFVRHFRPRVGLLMETEVWPNLVAVSRSEGIAVCLVNGRMSEKSLRQAQRLAWLSRPSFAALSAVWAQTEADAARLRQLGARVQGVTGNLKFDATPDAAHLARGRAWRACSTRPVLMFASAREGEEQMLLDVLQQRAARGEGAPGVLWLIVPRHPQRFDAVASLLQSAGLRLQRRSQWSDATPGPADAADVLLGDSLGEMALYFGLADLALLGGSFAPLGGQNLIEAAACGCPVLMGPHTFNFAQAAEMAAQAGAAVACADLAEAVEQALRLVHDAPRLAQLRTTAQDWAASHRGATARTVQALQAFLGPPA